MGFLQLGCPRGCKKELTKYKEKLSVKLKPKYCVFDQALRKVLEIDTKSVTRRARNRGSRDVQAGSRGSRDGKGTKGMGVHYIAWL